MTEESIHSRSGIGIDFGGTTVKIGLVTAGRIVEKRAPLPTQAFPSADALIEAMLADVNALCASHPKYPPQAIGVGLPGLVDREGGVVRGLTNVAGWDNVPLRQILKSRTSLPTELENDAKAMTYAEWKHGAAKGRRNVICVTLGTGVGGGLVLDGKLYRGTQGGAGEIGQTGIDANGRPGNFGNKGALEKYVGNAQIVERAQELYAAAGTEAPADLSPLKLEQAARSGDAVAQALWDEVGGRIGFQLANLVWLLNPDAIVIGGGVAKAGDLVFGPIRREIESRCSKVLWENLAIVPATLGSDAGLIGAAQLGLDAC